MRIIRGLQNAREFLEKLLTERSHTREDIEARVKEAIEEVKSLGDKAIINDVRQFQKVELKESDIKVSLKEIDESENLLSHEIKRAIKKAIERIWNFHERQKLNSWLMEEENGNIMGQKIVPIESVGIYVPGGRASYPSSLIMAAIPAKIAGTERIIVCTPPSPNGKINPAILFTAKELGINEIYKAGGAVAVAAMAFGTETIPKVNKVVGPGNIYVTMAKKLLLGEIGIDSLAGPSEICILADESANPSWIAADLISQAEHDPLSSAILITNSNNLAERVLSIIYHFARELPSKETIEESLQNYGAIAIVNNLDEGAHLVNTIAPEHLEIQTKEPFSILSKIKNAGTVFLGAYSSEVIGDYVGGPNHILPTSGTAKFFSGLSVKDFLKTINFLSISEDGFKELSDITITLAEAEGLHGHALSIKIRKQNSFIKEKPRWTGH
ncbi:MAG: histidinol dehydrogenase [bacterium]|nr:MAG: Histidinol dehydrogenase [bacterium 42_11]MDK2871403.1 histidinol dehydrogenase [bacterium]